MISTIIDWIQLYNTKHIGLKSFWSLLNLYKTAGEALKHVANPTSRSKAEAIYKNSNGNILIAIDDQYPKRLKQYTYPPPILYYSGNSSLLHNELLAFIGARNASLSGRNIAEKLAEQLSTYFTITSGIACGIDTSALIGAMKSNQPATVAVLPFGLDNIYPKENTKLFRNICASGLAITTVPPGHPPVQGMFLARNRLITMLSRGVVVIEAGLKSGTMNTANLALDTGCEVMVVPGSPLDPRSFGSNLLIKNGATLIQTAQDVLETMQPTCVQHSIAQTQHVNNNDTTCDMNRILMQLSSIPTSIDTLSSTTNIAIPEILSILSRLELDGKVAKTSNNGIVLL